MKTIAKRMFKKYTLEIEKTNIYDIVEEFNTIYLISKITKLKDYQNQADS